jgi:hypothetical protein
MISSRHVIFGLIAGVAGSCAVVLATQAMAQESTATSRQPYRARAWVAIDRCAAYGPEFTSVEGTQTCVKIGGHVRVEFGSRNFAYPANPGWGQGGTAPATIRTEGAVGSEPSELPAAHHLRLPQDAAPADQGGYLR